MKRIYITGANGFIAKHLIQHLKADGNYELVKVSKADGDISDIDLNFQHIDHVIHLAGLASVPESWTATKQYYKTNLMGTINVLEAARKYNTPAIILSSYMYGIPDYIPINEEHPVRAVNPYGHSKILVENLCKFYIEMHNLLISVIRPFNVYGPGQKTAFLIPELIAKVKDASDPHLLINDLTPKRDYLYVSDLTDLIIKIINKPQQGFYNAGSGKSHSVEQIAEIILKLANSSKSIVEEKKTRKNEINNVVADITKATETFSWKPKIDIEAGLKMCINEFENLKK